MLMLMLVGWLRLREASPLVSISLSFFFLRLIY